MCSRARASANVSNVAIAVLSPASTELRVAGRRHRRVHVVMELCDSRQSTRLGSRTLRPSRIWVYTADNYRSLQAIVHLNLCNCSLRTELNILFGLPAGSISRCQECFLKCVHTSVCSPAVPSRTGIAFSGLQDE